MIEFYQNLTIPIKWSQWKECEDYAKKVETTNHDEYSRRGQSNAGNNILQDTIGKAAEYGVHLAGFVFDAETTKPDFTVYPPGEKKHDADLFLLKDGTPIHVKAQTIKMAGRFGESWCFQNKGEVLFPGARDSDIVFFCLVNEEWHSVELRARCLARELAGLWEPPKKTDLISKKVIYMEHLQKRSMMA